MQFTIMRQGGGITTETPPGHYLDLRPDVANIIAVGCYAGMDAYKDVIPDFHVVGVAPMQPNETDTNPQVRMSIFLCRGDQGKPFKSSLDELDRIMHLKW